MLIRCPSCSTRYYLAEDAIGEGGRRVRCGNCRHVWLQIAPDDQSESEIEAEQVRGGKALDFQDIDIGEADDDDDDGVGWEDDDAVDGARKPMFAWLGRLRPSAENQLPIGFMIFAAAVVVIILLLLATRPYIVSVFPSTASLYEAIGMPTTPAVSGLEVQSIRRTFQEEQDGWVLYISGEIYNALEESVEIPTMRAALLDEKGNEIRAWEFTADSPALLPKDRSTFTTSVRNVDEAADNIEITFVP